MIRRGRERPRSCTDHSRTISKLYPEDHSDPEDPAVCCLIAITVSSPVPRSYRTWERRSPCRRTGWTTWYT